MYYYYLKVRAAWMCGGGGQGISPLTYPSCCVFTYTPSCTPLCMIDGMQASLGPSPWWARYLTQMQMVQFMLMNAQGVYLLWFGCPYPARLLYAYFAYVASLLLLFAQFYLSKHTSGSGSAGSKGKQLPAPKKAD